MPIVGSFAGASARAYGLGAGVALPGDFESIQTLTATGGVAASFDFTSIPQTYSHLQLRGIARDNTAGTTFDDIKITFNNDTGSNYRFKEMYGVGAGSPSFYNSAAITYIAGYLIKGANTANVFAANIIDILDYTNTNKNKTLRRINVVDVNGSGESKFGTGLWMNTSAISRITLTPNAGSFAQYSSFALYGVKA
jgi:hypothetical protein